MDYNSKWRQRNPEKVAAHIAVNHATRSGRLASQPCEKCGRHDAQAHHDDYSKPLDVRWLCPPHHRAEHVVESTAAEYVRKPVVYPWHAHYQPAPKRDVLLSTAQQLRSSGASYTQIANQLGVSRGTAYKWLNPTERYD